MTNHLANSSSPYLLQHADNPVDWYPWGETALKKARDEDKPIFLSIGYAACHWCHVMAHESFEDPEIAALMNERFINIKVDREERPDLDTIYMQAVVALTGHGGWPMSVFLTPDGKPFYGGTYFPPQARYQLPSFRQVLEGTARAWQENRPDLLESSQKITRHIQKQLPANSEIQITKHVLEEAVEKLFQGFDWQYGGWGPAPKFPQGMVIDFLLSQADRGSQDALEMALSTLDAMSRGGMYDLVGGGFSRYSVDNLWLVPHFEKMLYDNALLSRAYLHAYLISGNDEYRRVCQKTLDFIQREMTHPDGGFYSSLDADSEGMEGTFYLWSEEELRECLPGNNQAALFIEAHGVTPGGNFEGKTVLQQVFSDQELAERYETSPQQTRETLEECYQVLRESRSRRVRPATDDKIITSWNGLMISSFSEAGRYLNRPDYTDAAVKCTHFLLDQLVDEDNRLFRSWRNGTVQQRAFLEDYAALVLGLIAVYQSVPDNRYYQAAQQLSRKMLADFSAPDGGFYDTSSDHPHLIYRPRDTQDNATPSGNALAATALVLMAAYSGNMELIKTAREMAAGQLDPMLRFPAAFGQWLQAVDLILGPIHEVAVLGDPASPALKSLIEVLWEQYRPRIIVAQSTPDLPPGAPALLENRPLMEDKPTVYVCHDFSCNLPVTEADALRSQLED